MKPEADGATTLTAPAPNTSLLRVLGVTFGLAVTVGGTIGMGILRTPGEVAAQLPVPALFVGAWIAGGLYALLGAVSVAELGALVPRSGGLYVFARRALGPYAGFVVGWSDWISTCATLAVIALVIGEYTGMLVPALAGRDKAVALTILGGFAVFHWGGVRWGSRAQGLTSLLKALAFAALIAACFMYGGRTETAAPPAPPVLAGWGLLAALVVALQGVIYTYDGWYGPVYFGEEVRRPASDIPRAMIGGVLLVIVIYLLVNAALLYVLPLGRLAGDKLALGTAAGVIFGRAGGEVIAGLATISMLSTINAYVLSAPRILYAMGRDRLFWEGATRVNRGGTPTVALVLSVTVAVAFIATGTFNEVLAVLSFFLVTNYVSSFVSVFVLRHKEPDAPRPFRAWGYPWTTALALICSVAFLAGAIAADTQNSLYALGVLATSYPAYLLVKRLVRTTE